MICKKYINKFRCIRLKILSKYVFLLKKEGDITRQETVDQIMDVFKDKTELVVCDGAPDVTGFHEID